jgi:hypothetical protein
MSKIQYRFYPIIFVFLLTSSCSSLINRIAVKSTGGILSHASDEVLTEGNWDIFYYGVPGNLKLMEGLFHIVPDDRHVLSSLVKGYAGYAFVVNETLSLDEEYSEVEVKPNTKQAIFNYSKAVDYGQRFIATYGFNYDDILKATSETGKAKKMLSRLGTSKFELETLFFIGQAYGGLILFNRDDMSLVAKRPMVKAIFDYVCEIMPNINNGACDIFYGANLLLTPAMMGGNPSKGKDILEKAMVKYPKNYFIRIAYLQFYVIPFEEEEIFEDSVKILNSNEREFNAALEFDPNSKDNQRSNLRLFQAVAFKRLEIIKKHIDNFF